MELGVAVNEPVAVLAEGEWLRCVPGVLVHASMALVRVRLGGGGHPPSWGGGEALPTFLEWTRRPPTVTSNHPVTSCVPWPLCGDTEGGMSPWPWLTAPPPCCCPRPPKTHHLQRAWEASLQLLLELLVLKARGGRAGSVTPPALLWGGGGSPSW